ncbi:OB-fold nucleic acid binding domain-containing protein [Methanocalculus sp.]|uniref:OB-fold nucleic acid binding domain-containing protein n=1 Tax=Methanocalculus sp. TaxID=2004547 RepID=UPI0027221922|nr:OB-fold nucleic acid binding domain-containing protein [Methanocalculus sp.]MDO8840844.1 OB-fold nucleic acid binding domain-containing protein [Methanocalculus sp.]
MRFHYALVDDLLTREEFDRQVEEMVASHGGLIDETAAALLVVEGTGRSHQKIGAITPSPTLVSLYGKVAGVSTPKEFTRDDGSEGCVARVEVADETGTVTLVLWDQMAAGVVEIEEGTVIEVIGRPKEGRRTEVHALAVRETAVEISLDSTPKPTLSRETEIDARILAVGPTRTITRRDGGEGKVTEAIIGDATGCARFITWSPALFDTLTEGASVRIQGALRRSSDEGIEYVAQEETRILPLDHEVPICLTPPGEVMDKGVYSVRGTITTLHPARPFTTRRGEASWVRNLFIDGPLRIVIWGERARDPFLCGETIEVYNASARLNRYGDVELSVGFGSAIRVIPDVSEEMVVEGVTILSPEGISVFDAGNLYILEYAVLPLASRFRLKGRLSGRRFLVDEAEPIPVDPTDLEVRAEALCGSSLSPPEVRLDNLSV